MVAWDGDQFRGAADLEAWAKLLADYQELEAWQTPTGRRAQFFYERREGCDPRDFYVSYAEMGSWVVRVTLNVPPGTKYREMEPLLEAFINVPLGPPSAAAADQFLAGAEASVAPDWPCSRVLIGAKPCTQVPGWWLPALFLPGDVAPTARPPNRPPSKVHLVGCSAVGFSVRHDRVVLLARPLLEPRTTTKGLGGQLL